VSCGVCGVCVRFGCDTPDLFARQDELVTKVGEVKKFDAKTRQLSFRGKLPSSCPYLFFFAGETDGKGQRPPAQSPDGQVRLRTGAHTRTDAHSMLMTT
jgi:hypothetical protein